MSYFRHLTTPIRRRVPVRVAAVGAGLAAAAVLALPPAAQAAPVTYTVTTDRVQAAAGWLATQFVDEHLLPAPAGDRFVSGKYGTTTYLNYGENADAIFGLAAAKSSGSKIATAWRYLEGNVDAYTDLSSAQGGPFDGPVGKTALAAIVAGADPTSVGGHNLLQALKVGECSAPSDPGCAAAGGNRNTFSSNSESFVLLAEARAGGAYTPSAAKVGYFLSLQCANGGFTGNLTPCGSGDADLDATSYATMALEALGGHRAEVARATAWLKGQQHAGGYWISQNVPNVNSTGLAAAALQGAGTGTAAAVGAARTWLRSQQVPAAHVAAGAFRFGGSVDPTTTTATSPSVLATAQALTGLVDGGGLATVTGSGAASPVALYAPAVTTSAATVRAGLRLNVDGVGFVAGERVRVSVHSTTVTVTVATVTADPLGSVRSAFTVPATLSNGAHTVVLTGVTSGLVARRAVTVTGGRAASSSPAAPVSSAASPTPPRASTGSALEPAAAGATTADTGQAGGATPADTGQDGRHLVVLALAGLLSVLAGCGFVLAGRNRGRVH